MASRPATGVISCPSCGGPLRSDAKWCPACHFTGSHTIEMFPGPPPPLLPVLDAVGLLQANDEKKILAAMDGMGRRFPQFRWRVCIIDPPGKQNLPVFGFRLLNVCPLDAGETDEDRSWTILLLLDSGKGEACVVPGYAAEPYLSNDEWKAVLATMAGPWRSGKPAAAILQFFKTTRAELNRAWKRYGARRSSQ